jgi:hypothetical protein
MGLLYGRAGRLTAQNGGFRPGQWVWEHAKEVGHVLCQKRKKLLEKQKSCPETKAKAARFLRWVFVADERNNSAPHGEKQEDDRVRDEENAMKLFREVDINGNGKLEGNELRQLVARLGKRLTHGDLKSAMDEMDRDGSGTVTLAEFIKWWGKLNEAENAEASGRTGAPGAGPALRSRHPIYSESLDEIKMFGLETYDIRCHPWYAGAFMGLKSPRSGLTLRDGKLAHINRINALQVCQYMIQPLVELCGGCMVALKVS